MRVCFVGSVPKPYGGVASHSYHLTEALARLGVHVEFIDTRLSEDKNIPPGVHYHQIANLNFPSILKQVLKLPRLFRCLPDIIKCLRCLRLRELVKVVYIIIALLDDDRAGGADLLHAQHMNERAFATWLAAKKHNRPLVVTAHCAEFTDEAFWSRCSRLVRYTMDQARSAIVVSQFTHQCMVSRGGTGDVHVIPNGVDADFFRPGLDVQELRARHGLTGDENVILFVGDLHRRKGPDVLLRAVPLLAEKRVRVLIIGTRGGHQQHLRELAEELSITGRMEIIEEVAFELLPRYYNLADLLVFPTVMKTEGFGIVALEAMACGTPVVASRIGAIPEVVREDETGFLFQPGDFQELSEKIDLLLGDHERRSAFARAGRRLVESEYTWDRVARRTLDVYRSVLESDPGEV
jgi:glycosyltransferase involved in cell wall biosynthesis